jgi:hypothetical protein
VILSAEGVEMATELRRAGATTLSEFIEIVEGTKPVTSAGLWFRGQASSKYRLEPGAVRHLRVVADARGLPVSEDAHLSSSGTTWSGPSAERMLQNFKLQARPFLEFNPSNDYEWMFLAQHHGLPTRLLDWSTNAMVALYFALSTAKAVRGNPREEVKKYLDLDRDDLQEGASAVFIIDPGLVNDTTVGVRDTVNPLEDVERWANYLTPMEHSSISTFSPMCIVAPHISPRIRAQSGAFTIQGANIWPLDYFDLIRPLITKIFIPHEATSEILNSLHRMGMSKSFIYPSLDTVAEDVARIERERYRFDSVPVGSVP